MIARHQYLRDTEAGPIVVSAFDAARLGGFADVEAASRELRKRSKWLDPEPLICGGFETRKAHPETGLRLRTTFWADE